jgi:outer membrane protein assembly factor BamE (lipoprotein component of BamABCDE complex)
MFKAVWLALAVLGLLAACDSKRIEKLEEGVSTEADVRKQFGDPASVATRADGTRVLEYPRQPEGWTNYEIRIGPDGKMSSLRQLLTDANFAKVRPGMKKAEVLETLGRAAKSQFYENKREEVWEWRYQSGPESRLFSVIFDLNGEVTGSGTMLDPRDEQGSKR